MVSFFCPNCWASVAESTRVCPRCKIDIVQWKSQHDYADELIAALWHPIPTTPVIAAQILGDRREQKAVPALIRVLHETTDAYLAEAVVEALSKIDNVEAAKVVRAACQHHFTPRPRESARMRPRRFQPPIKCKL